jgi:hypothetical protein
MCVVAAATQASRMVGSSAVIGRKWIWSTMAALSARNTASSLPASAICAVRM